MRPWNYSRVRRSCIQCDASFLAPARSPREHCGDTCARKSQAARREAHLVPVYCQICGQQITRRRETSESMRKVCSATCLAAIRRGRAPGNKLPRVEIICNQCGAEFQVSTHSRRRYCSPRCATISRAAAAALKDRPRVAVKCERCGSEQVVSPARAKTYRFCSRRCTGDNKRDTYGPRHHLWKPKAQCLCQQCGRSFETKPAKVKMGEGRFCSRSCLGGWVASHQPRISSLENVIAAVLSGLGIPFQQQARLGSWCVDFYLAERRLVIECDGSYWHSLPTVVRRDLRKDQWLARHGYKLLRLPEGEIRSGVAALRLVTVVGARE